jgi:hypothetical protein
MNPKHHVSFLGLMGREEEFIATIWFYFVVGQLLSFLGWKGSM